MPNIRVCCHLAGWLLLGISPLAHAQTVSLVQPTLTITCGPGGVQLTGPKRVQLPTAQPQANTYVTPTIMGTWWTPDENLPALSKITSLTVSASITPGPSGQVPIFADLHVGGTAPKACNQNLKVLASILYTVSFATP